ncbi:Nse1 non-SMC component of SMC5-6 complex-domain-containing protein [Zychaea mexicana]|uniref:Nse1 non-SMC component of SMC5-6 complex-domain-containing protein n=1 Tax=Zychaea mexicana TaxID=64656 RepID=UPI0022FE13CE|nr:Nse1 non-SMC component of SMC5-6 complex-domain-containing protein [Zychaea mexicana]KAI9498136.1 Nse1 non-SMC component of SMC5-6 complex-domain-containing protein [Zychaea mexicana]
MAGGFMISSADETNGGHNAAYNDSHRLFMQTMLSHRVLTEEQAEVLYTKICHLVQCERSEFAEFISDINAQINDIDLSLRRSRDERDGSPLVGLVNTKEDEVAQIATKYTASEIAYFRQMLELIVMADDEKNAVGSMAALRLGQSMKPPMSQKDTQTLIDRLVEDGWICLTPDGSSYTVDTRGILELQNYLREQYGDVIQECAVCMGVITMGERCELQSCNVRIHRHCADTYFRGGQMSCPTCETGWSRANTYGLGLPL